MISKKALAAIPLALVLLVGVSACAPETGGPNGAPHSSSSQGGTGSGPLDADGFAIPGSPVTLQLGDSVSYYSYPNLSKDDAQRVTIHSFEYIDKNALPADASAGDMQHGVLKLSVSWEGILGDVQSNSGYILPTLASGEEGIERWFGPNQLDNGGVDFGETRSGLYRYEIPRGKTTLTIVDYTDKPVALLHIDTSN